MSRAPKTSDKHAEFLAIEYDYIAQTAVQTNEDRARVSSFYMIAVGSLVAALFSTQFFDVTSPNKTINIMFGILFILLTLLGISTILQLARLRAAWFESIEAMNHIKDFVIQQNPSLTDAFQWKSGSLPPRWKKNSMSYYQAVEVAMIGGLMFGAGMFFLQQAFFLIGIWNWGLSIALGLVMISIQLEIYRRSLH